MSYTYPITAGLPVRPASAAVPATKSGTLRIVALFGLDIVSASAATVLDRLMQPSVRTRVAFLNAHCANVAARDADYHDALSTADMVLPDGIGVEIAARLKGERIAENLNGTDFTPRLMARAASQGLAVYLLGGRPGVAEAAARKLCLDHPGLRIVGTRDGYGGLADDAAAIDEINAARPDILLVALGVPMQDRWLADNAHRLDARITMGVGALFDFLAGRVARAPKIVRRARAEWAWRLAMEPRRMAGRYLVGNATFLARAATAALAGFDRLAAIRRALDLALAGGALLALAPVALLLAAAIRLESRGPVLFCQTRIGKDGVPFRLYKFRSMHVDAEARRAALLAVSDRAGICFKSRNDPR